MTDARRDHRRVELTHIDGLDGLRGLAVIAVVLYHSQLSWASGGFLGVELFFVLSGFLITSLLVREWLSSGSVVLRNFWARRARRLLPALFVLAVVIGIYYALKGTLGAVPGLFGDGLSALFYYSNWHQIATGANYFVTSGPTSPFQHTWSLAIEEQFYVVWPLLVLGVAFVATRSVGGRRGTPSHAQATSMLNAMLGLSLLLLIGSAIDTVALYHGGSGRNRVYMGTDTRAYGLLAGASLAILMARLRLAGRLAAGVWETGGSPSDPGSRGPRPARGTLMTPVVSLGSAVALAVTLVFIGTTNGDDSWLYPWGFLAVDLLSVTLIAVIMTSPRTIANRIFSLGPLRWIGKISYGLYLWHFPLFLWLDQSGTGLSGFRLLVLRLAVSLAVAVLSYYIVEQPIRQRRWPAWIVRGLAPVTAGAAAACLALAASVAAIPTANAHLSAPGTNLAGTDAACHVKLANSTYVGTVTPPQSQEGAFEVHELELGTATWPAAHTTKTFTTCPPKRALVVGDSIAFSITLPLLYDEQKYGMALANGARLGCSFAIRGKLNLSGKWDDLPADCPNELTAWAAEASKFNADEIIFELGYRDEFQWQWNGKLVHLGQPTFDAYVKNRIKEFIRVLGENGKRKLLFLSIPFVDPPAQANGSTPPQGTALRHDEINAIIKRAAASAGTQNASFLDIDKWLSPNNHYTANVNGQLCRFDGIHVTPYCADLLEPHIFKAARALTG